MLTMKYWHNLGAFIDTKKYKIPKQWRVVDTFFTSLENIGGLLSTRHPKNLNNVHKDGNDILSVLFVLGTDVHGGVDYERHWEKSTCS